VELSNTPRAATTGGGLDDQVYQRLLKERIIFLGSVVEDSMANAICAQMLLLAAEDPEKDIYLYINSPGGSISAGMAIYDTMQYIKNDVATVAMGLAASMGQFLLCAGTAGKRYALPHARIMMHQPSGGIGCTASDIKIQAEQMSFTKKSMAELIAFHTGQKAEIITEDSDRDRWFTAAEAKEYGFVDHITSRYILPTIEERTSYGYKRLDPYTKLFEERIIFLGQGIDDTVANDVMAQLLTLESMDPDRDIMMYINSPGGSFTALTAIYDTMQFVRPDVMTICLGQAASAAAVLLAGGAPGKRYALEHARILIHQPYSEGGGQGSDIEIQAKEILRMRTLLEEMLARHSKKDQAAIAKDIERDKILTSAEAVEYGLIDQVLASRKAKAKS